MSVIGTLTGWSSGVAAALLLATLAPASSALAATGDFRTGTFSGRWCGYEATFDVTDQDGWVFTGYILIESTGQYDPLWIEQYADNSLRVIRYLQGQHNGLTQVAQTYSPYQRVASNGNLYTRFEAEQGYGIGCDGNTDSRISVRS